VIKETGNIVEYGGYTYEFGNGKDAIGFLDCCNDSGGRPGSCAIEWRCISKRKKVHQKDMGLER